MSGAVDPDIFTIQRSYKDANFKILERKLGGKESFVHMAPEGSYNNLTFYNKLWFIDKSI